MPPVAPLPPPRAPPQQSPPSRPWFRELDPQSLIDYFSSTMPTPPTPFTDWVADSYATNQTTPHPSHIYSPRPPSFSHHSSIIVGNCSVLPVTSVGDLVLPKPLYLNDVLLALDLVQSLLSVNRFTTDNSCYMELDQFGLFVRDPATKRVIARYYNTCPIYTLPLPTSTTPTSCVVMYALAAAASSVTWHHRLCHPGVDVLAKLLSSSAITCPRDKHDSLCHAC
jgi:hypothetical protein